MTTESAVIDAPTAVGDVGVRVLVVEDSIDHQMLMVRRLRAIGITVTAVSSAEEALQSLEGMDLVLLDYRLPGANGLDVLRQIQATPDAPSVIMVTGMGSTDVAVEAMRAGAIDFLAKGAGYLDALPEVVLRAHRHHDLEQRAAELQRLALLVTSASDRETLFAQIVSGARRLLRAESCVLLLADSDGADLVATTMLGPEPDDLADVLKMRSLAKRGSASPEPQVVGGRMLVPLPQDGGDAVGLLAVWVEGHSFTPGDLDLARAFAAFGGMAIRNLRQRELERELLAELQQTVSARQDFIASISHELRTPLACIGGFAQTLTAHGAALEAEVAEDMLGRIVRNARDMQGLVDDLIELAALDRGMGATVTPRALDLGVEVDHVLRDAADILEGRELSVDLARVSVVADQLLLRRTLVNFLTNAVKFSAPGAPIMVRAATADDMVTIEVEDHGVGLAPRESARVFDPFFRAVGSVANAVRGSGIGLALVKEYVRTMGGTVGVRSVPGEGSTFWFTLPVATHAREQQAGSVMPFDADSPDDAAVLR